MINQNILNLLAAGNYREAARRLTKLLPRDVGGSVHYHLGLCYFFLGELERAHALVIQSIKAAPKNPDHFNALALVEEARGKFGEALSAIESAIPLAPEIPDFRNTKAKILLSLQRNAEVISILKPIVASYPLYIEAVLNLAAAYVKLERHTDLIELLDRVEYVDLPDYRPYYWLANAFSYVGNSLSSGRQLGKYLTKKYAAEYLHRVELLSSLATGLEELIGATPSYYETEADTKAAVHRFERAILKLREPLEGNQVSVTDRQLVLDLFFKVTNFYLGYQQLEDASPNRAYADLVRAYLAAVGIFPDKLDRPQLTGPIRIAVISENIGLHITTWSLDWLQRARTELGAEITVYCVNHPPRTGLADELIKIATVVPKIVNEDSFLDFIITVRRAQHHLVFFPDIGMCPSSRMLSMVRMAPVQAVHWGHPVTTGSAAIDVFLSGRLMEQANAQDNYTERLIRLPSLGAAFVPEIKLTPLICISDDTSQTQGSLNPPDNNATDDDYYDFCSVQSLFKHLPQFDHVYLEILRLTSETTIGFLHAPNDASKKFFERIRLLATTMGIDPARIREVRRRPHSDYLKLLARIKVTVDAIGWSGGNTTLNSLGVGTPVLSMTGSQMRANHTAGIYRRMGLNELICKNKSEFITLGCRLILDDLFRESIREKIMATLPIVYEHEVLNRNVLRLLNKIPTQ